MIRKYQVVLSLFLVLLIAIFSGCTAPLLEEGPEITESFYAEYEIVNNTVVNVENINGNIQINKWDGDRVVLDAVKKTRFGEDELDKVEIIATQDDTKLRIEVKHAVEWARVSVDIDIKVPDNVTVDYVRTSNGNVQISGVEGDVEASSSNGNVIVTYVNGYVKASTSNGNIEIRDTTGVQDLKTSNGAILAEISGTRDDVDITSLNGKITVYLNPAMNIDIKGSVSNGRISTDDLAMNLTTMKEHYIEGKLGDGGNKIFMSVSNGNINLDKLDD